MHFKTKTLSILSCLALNAGLWSCASFADNSTYNNVFMSYYSPENVTAMVNYAKDYQVGGQTKPLGGLIMWTIQGDAPYGSSASLLSAANKAYQLQSGDPVPHILGYWTNWSVYTQKAIPTAAYPVPGSQSAGNVVQNADFTNKLEGMNAVAYAFVEAQAKTYSYYDSNAMQQKTVTNPNYDTEGGTLYFFDPWADLLPYGQDSFCKDTSNAVCWYVDNMQGIDPTTGGASSMGNFEAFATLKHADSNNALGPLKKLFSVGGYAHDDTFEDAFNSTAHINNFVNSAKQIIDQYHMDGIDLDYENPNMSFQQSNDFSTLVTALRAALPNATIDVTVLSNPEYLSGANPNQVGFAPGVLQHISTLASHINLMTYDFHGAFDYTSDPNTGVTGFLTNLYMPSDSSAEDAVFSVDTSATSAIADNSVDPSKVTLGIPAYGRTLAGINDTNGGLFQIIPSTATVPRGDLDAPGCATGLPVTGNSCSGAFLYSYIVDNMLGHGFTATPRTDDKAGVSNGITAYAPSWTVPASSS